MKYILFSLLFSLSIMSNSLEKAPSNISNDKISKSIEEKIELYYHFVTSTSQSELDIRYNIFINSLKNTEVLLDNSGDSDIINNQIKELITIMKNSYVLKKKSLEYKASKNPKMHRSFEKRIFHLIDIVDILNQELNQ